MSPIRKSAQGRASCLNARTCAGGSHNPLGRLVRPDCHGYDHYRVFQCVAGATQPQRVCQEEEPCERDRECTNLWFVRSFAKRKPAKFNGCASDRFVVHLMECQWRYNHRNDNLVRELANILKRHESRTLYFTAAPTF